MNLHDIPQTEQQGPTYVAVDVDEYCDNAYDHRCRLRDEPDATPNAFDHHVCLARHYGGEWIFCECTADGCDDGFTYYTNVYTTDTDGYICTACNNDDHHQSIN